MGQLRTATGNVEGAVLGGALVAGAGRVLAAQLRPGHPLAGRAQDDLAQVARLAMGQPEEDAGVEGHLIGAARPGAAHLLEEAGTEVVTAPFAHGDAQVEIQRVAQRRHVLVNQLVLQVDGIGGDDDAAAVLRGPESGRQ